MTFKGIVSRGLRVGLITVAAGCGDDFGGTVTPSEALQRQQTAVTARATALMCQGMFTITLNAGPATECSLADVNTCVARINAAATCDAILPAYLGCTVRHR